MEHIAHGFIGWTGQEIELLTLPWSGAAPAVASVRVTGPAVETAQNAYLHETRGRAPGDVLEVRLEDGVLNVRTEPFTNRVDWTLELGGTHLGKAQFTMKTRTADDKFVRLEEGRVQYRLYSPAASTPRPMILFLHGGGNGGYEGERDNNKHLVTDYGPVNLAEDYPDVYVMAPQCVEERREINKASMNRPFAQSNFSKDPRYGWSRYYLGLVCDIIRRMIGEGKVDPRRVYVTGMSMGGAGTIRAMSVGSDLFAAAVPICPSMTPETFDILRTIRRPVWVATAYVDHTIYRHKYIVDAVMQMRDEGNNDAHLTIFSPEDMAKYDIGITPDLDYFTLFQQNHYSWVPTYKDEYGIISWLLNQAKN